MANKISNKIAHATGCNCRLNRKILCMKRSWDEVAAILHHISCSKSCCKSSPKKPKR